MSIGGLSMGVRAMSEGTDSTVRERILADRLAELPGLGSHPCSPTLLEIAGGETHISSAGFPYISDRSFRQFIAGVPHLFEDGSAILGWLGTLEEQLGALEELSAAERESIARAVRVLRTVVFTAGVTAPSDLWLLGRVLASHRRLGTLEWLLAGNALEPEDYAAEHGLRLEQLQTDLHFLCSRGYLRKGDGDFLIAERPEVARVLEGVRPPLPEHRIHWVPRLVEQLSGGAADAAEARGWLRIETDDAPTGSWVASLFQIELGGRLLPLVLALRVLGQTAELTLGTEIAERVPALTPEMRWVLERAGLLRAGRISQLGARVLSRGPGPFGIIGAYHGYLQHHEALLRGDSTGVWVQRGENVAASQDANRKSFREGNARLDTFCERYGFRYRVFIEHAVGQGEATRQRFAASGEDDIRYFGADLEDAAIERASEQRRRGFLPRNMELISAADIGEPRRVIGFLEEHGVAGEPAVMMVGNGFHEIREQTNEKMLAVFRDYCEAGFVLIFTEETALSDEALLHTAWNTYHAGFRYVHEISGQGLRPAGGAGSRRWSWSKCATRGGYVVLDELCYRSRTIYPHRRPKHKNPSISTTYFCVPRRLAAELGIVAEE